MTKKYNIVMLSDKLNTICISDKNAEFIGGEWGIKKAEFTSQNIPEIQFIGNDRELSGINQYFDKIVASSKHSLGLPRIPDSYIKYWIREYMHDNMISEIDLKLCNGTLEYNTELEGYNTKDWICSSCGKMQSHSFGNCEELKLNNNEVIPVIPTSDNANSKNISNNKQSIEEFADKFTKFYQTKNMAAVTNADLVEYVKEGIRVGNDFNSDISYSEEEVLNLLNKLYQYIDVDVDATMIPAWFNKYKK